MQTWKCAVAKVTERYADKFGRNNQNADSYALGDLTQPLLMSADGMTETQIYDAAGSQRRQERSEYRSKRRDERLDYRYGSAQVATVSQDHPDAGSSQRQRTNGQQQWLPKNDGKRPYD